MGCKEGLISSHQTQSFNLKISVITVVFNRAGSITQAVRSVQGQTWGSVEHVVIDGASTDGTTEAIRACVNQQTVWISEPDLGIYHAINKGLELATGEVIGLLHSDDFFSDEYVLARIAGAFADPSVDAVYGDLEYVAKNDTSRIIRRWRAGNYRPSKLAYGWMPPHPTLYLRRSVIERWGGYDTCFRIAADYDLILRIFGRGQINPFYVPFVLVKMRIGGLSNRSFGTVWLKICEDYAALRRNGVGGLWALAWKNISKLGQFWIQD